jgi:hypothetical protein
MCSDQLLVDGLCYYRYIGGGPFYIFFFLRFEMYPQFAHPVEENSIAI